MSSKKPKNAKVCLHCGLESIAEANFYKSRNKIIDSDVYSICKNCASRLGNTDIETFHEVLMVLNIPFIPDDYKRAEGKDNPFGHYMLLLNNPRKRNDVGRFYNELTYADSPTREQITDVDEYIYSNIENLGDLISLFGNTWTSEELISMNKELEEMIVQYGGSKEDLATVDLYSELVLCKWLSRRAYNNNDMKTGNDMSKMRATLLKNNGLTLQDVRDKNNLDSLGIKIDLAEDRPIVPNKKYHDVDGIWYMFKKLIKHMERFIGADKSSVDDDYAEMQEYVDTHEHYSEGME